MLADRFSDFNVKSDKARHPWFKGVLTIDNFLKELLEEGDFVKKIVAAWIEQILEFDRMSEYIGYVESLKQKKQKFKSVSFEQLESGVVRIRIRKQYNNNNFPE